MIDPPSGPEVLFSLAAHKVHEVVSLGPRVQRHGSHAVLPAVARRAAVTEPPAALSPGNEVIPSLKLMVATASTSSSTCWSSNAVSLLWPSPSLGPLSPLSPATVTPEEVSEAVKEPLRFSQAHSKDCGEEKQGELHGGV